MNKIDCCEWCQKPASVIYWHLTDTYDMCNDCASDEKLHWIRLMLGTFNRW